MNSDQIISDVIHEAGFAGLGYIGLGALITLALIGFGIFVWYKYFKKNKLATNNDNVDLIPGSLLLEYLKEIKNDIKEDNEHIYSCIENITTTVNTLENNMNNKFTYLDTKFDEKFTELDNKVKNIPTDSISKIIEQQKKQEELDRKKHKKAFNDALRLGDEVYDILLNYTKEINCQHIFVGSFHNGSESLEGIPYIKMDIIREVYHPTDVHELDHPFAPVYKDCELSLLGKLPKMLIQNKELYFKIDDDGTTDMHKYDSLVVRRMLGMEIKQIALHVTQEKGVASGFVGCVRYDLNDMNLEALSLCAKELEIIHNNTKGL